MKRAILSETFLHPGEFHFAAAPAGIGTLLGSCVAITMWHPVRRVGGMCHIMLPGRNRPVGSSLDPRYADEAVELFAVEAWRRKISPSGFRVKLFGGGRMFGKERATIIDVGRRNVDAADRALDRHGFVVTHEHVGGTAHRRLHFDLLTGDVWLAVANRQPEFIKGVA